ncbi:MAG: glutamate synthase large subunit [bacterium]|nr:glutamate synthase large subunit [bacterium]
MLNDGTSEPYQREAAAMPAPYGLYDTAYDHDSCGVGFVADLSGEPQHELIEAALQVLVNLEHRGAIGGDAATGDGAGILLQMPDAFLRGECAGIGIRLPERGRYGAGLVFLPREAGRAEVCRKIFEQVVEEEGCEVLGWRVVPMEAGGLGVLSRATQPTMEQLFVGCGRRTVEEFARRLYIIRRRVENAVAARRDGDYSQFYVPSLSPHTIVYKGMLTGTQLQQFFPEFHDARFAAAFAVVHQRFSTNTLPTWSLAQPFRYVAHNGEINTLRGNVNRMHALEAQFASPLFGEDIEKIKPVIVEGGSDSAMFDNALELLIMAGRSLPHAAMMMVPEAWGPKYTMSEDKRAFYEYHAAIMEPWDGPAAMVITDGRYIGALLDRNGLRPARYTITRDGLIVMASETGVIEMEGARIQKRGRLQPGKMFLVDMVQRRVVSDSEIKGQISRQKPYRRWVRDNVIHLRGLFAPSELPVPSPAELLQWQHAFGYTEEELKMILAPMASQGQEPVGSMGNDAALAVLSNKPRLLFDYFKQLFAQVTNPPIDPLREELVMSLMSFIGRVGNILEEKPEHCRQLKLPHPILMPADVDRLRGSKHPGLVVRELEMLFPAGGGGEELAAALNALFKEAEECVRAGATILILSDRNVSAKRAPIPALLAVSGLHHYLIRKGLRTLCGLVVETGEAREVNHFCLLISYGASAICPYVALATVRSLAEQGLLEHPMTADEAVDAYVTAVKKGILKTLSRMGISTVRSYRGAQIFEAIGLAKEVTEMYFARTASRIGGVGLDVIAREANMRHAGAFPKVGAPSVLLPVGGEYHERVEGERHLFTPEAIYLLQLATRTNDYSVYQRYARCIDDQSEARVTLRSLLRFRPGTPVPVEEVEPVEAITRRFVTAAMSYGSISKEAHEAIAIALNRIGGRSNSGEGGEDPERYIPLPNGDLRVSRIKQVASARFGVTIEYLINADELQIKIAQGAKPGEGGQLPGHKVSEDIARVRHTTPGVTLISPPPHHDIYSIEDLAQLIYDLKMANPRAKVSVKLVSEVGVGTIAAGVAKAKADLVLIAGYDGGTGASPLTSIKHCGLPWELGLVETQHALIANHLRDRIVVQADGQMRTGRDVVIAALLGAEEYGFGTVILVTLGCILMRKCHLNTCPVGVATQDPVLRSRFTGSPDYVERYLRFVARDVREHMARLGFRTMDEMIGRVEMLDFEPAVEHWKARGVDLRPLLAPPPGNGMVRRCVRGQEHEVNKSLDVELIQLAAPAFEDPPRAVAQSLRIRNVHRTVGAMLSGEVTRRWGARGLPRDTIRFTFTGSAGQSFGAFLAPGITLRLEGDANDYVGKGLSGGTIIVVPPRDAHFVAHENIIVGNVVLYGATSGELYVCGMAGERFAVRNSGAIAVVEGVGDHGCEYMTGGRVVVLGQTGVNFAAGMSGGIAYVYDENELFGTRCNLDMVDLETVWTEADQRELHALITQHLMYTGSARAQYILDNWETCYPLFVKVMPMDYKRVLERMRVQEHTDNEAVPATEEVFRG